MQNGDLISIIIPVYKVEAYLKECLDSVINQTYKDLEIILVDDGSPDNSGKMCDEYAQKDSRIKVIHKENGGLSSARNAGLDIATGEYVCFIDSDDVIDERYIEILHNMCVENNVDIAECGFERFIDAPIFEKNNKNSVQLFSPNEMQYRLYSDDAVRTTVVWNKMYKKYVYENKRFPNGKIHEDEYTTYKVFYDSKSNIAVTNLILYHYRVNSESITGRKYNVKRLDALDAFEERKDFYLKNGEHALYIKALLDYSKKLRTAYLMTSLFIESNKKEILKKVVIKSNKLSKKILCNKDISVFEKFKFILFKLAPDIYILRGKKEYMSENK